ncbi:MAG: nickel-type superoxide dismutase maturation protease [Candidatus Marsarchaeota archaeon]|jgi:nickel-type superoxide dismutase maturation protease|nr:nickel-type superoxide dismutase maturation protease [Candidatus Marsarchaeota archaeon]MCL5115199.1 nickel-type superoxide dismutase maturation protease [Candidatus Marsarchaeota archaeon]
MPISIFRVKDRSMLPALGDGDYVIVSRLSYLFSAPKISDIIVLKHPEKGILIVKRISKVRGKKFYVLGDNAAESYDSRDFGYVDRHDIFGKVVYVIRK